MKSKQKYLAKCDKFNLYYDYLWKDIKFILLKKMKYIKSLLKYMGNNDTIKDNKKNILECMRYRYIK